MTEFFSRLFSSDFMPHGGCYFWRPGLVWLHASSDALIAVAYFLIPFSLVQLVRKRRDLEFNWMFVLFGVFILACGMTHAMQIWNVWHSAYRLEGLIKLITAVASIITAILMFRLVPKALSLASPRQLQSEILERRRAEEEVRVLNSELERRVEERTAMLLRSNQALQRFAYIASHDLQEPIRTVRSLNQLLARDYRGRLGERAERYFELILEASDRMQTLVKDILTYSATLDRTAEAGKSGSTKLILQEALHDLSAAISQSNAVIEYGELPDVLIDATQLKQIFLNLISNALKYRKPGQAACVRISAEQHGQECIFSIADNGIGIEPKYFEQIFIAFRRLHGREYPGSGVGLTICKNLVEEHNGRMWVSSTVGEGSTFSFTLPLAVRESASVAALQAQT